MSDDSRAPMARRGVLFHLAGEDAVQVTGHSYTSSAGERLPIDVYVPPATMFRGPRPAVLLVPGYNDAGMRRIAGCAAKDMGAFRSWARLLAASGITAVAYECRDPAADARLVVAHIRAVAELSLDARRIGVWSCSGHGPTAIGLSMDEPALGCAAVLYGYLLDLEGHAEVAEAAATFRFAHATADRRIDDLPASMPTLLVRAGLDAMPGLNASMDRLVAQALARNLPLTLVNHTAGPHAFDIEDDSPRSRAVIRQVLAFYTANLQP